MDGVRNISFNIYADSDEEAQALKGAIVEFINWFGKRGVKVKANAVAKAINGWESNALIRNQIIKYINNGN